MAARMAELWERRAAEAGMRRGVSAAKPPVSPPFAAEAVVAVEEVPVPGRLIDGMSPVSSFASGGSAGSGGSEDGSARRRRGLSRGQRDELERLRSQLRVLDGRLEAIRTDFDRIGEELAASERVEE